MALVTKTGTIGAPPKGFLGKPGNGGAENEIESGTDHMEATYTVASDCAITVEFVKPGAGLIEVFKRPGGDANRAERIYTNSTVDSGDVLGGTRVAKGDVVFLTHDNANGRKYHRIITEA